MPTAVTSLYQASLQITLTCPALCPPCCNLCPPCAAQDEDNLDGDPPDGGAEEADPDLPGDDADVARAGRREAEDAPGAGADWNAFLEPERAGAGGAGAGAEDNNWNPMDWDRAAEELTWERLLGLDGSLVFLEHVFWVVSLNTLFILVFGEDGLLHFFRQ